MPLTIVTTKYAPLKPGKRDELRIQNAASENGIVELGYGTFSVAAGSSTEAFSGVGGYNIGIGRSGVVLRGAGPGLTTIRPNVADFNLIGNTVQDIESLAIYDLTLDHDAVTLGSTTSGRHGISLYRVSKFRLQNVEIMNVSHHGLATLPETYTEDWNTDYFIDNVKLYNIGVNGHAGGDGLRIFYGAGNVNINNVIVDGVELHGIHTGYGNANISNVTVKQAGTAAFEIQSHNANLTNVQAVWDDVISDLLANRPAAGTTNRMFYSTNSSVWFRDNGSSWESLTAARVRGIRIQERDSNYPDALRTQVTNAKIRFTVDEQQTYSYNADNYGVIVSGTARETELHNVEVDGKFRRGALLQTPNISWIGGGVKGTRQYGIHLGTTDSNSSAITKGQRVEGALIQDVSQSTAGNYFGIFLDTTVHGAVIKGNQVLGTQHGRAISESSAGSDSNIITGNYVEASSNTIVKFGANTIVRDNRGFKTEASGTWSISSGATTIGVDHTLAITPTVGQINLTADNALAALYVTNIGASSFTVNATGSSGATGGWAVANI